MPITTAVNREIIRAREAPNPDASLAAIQFELGNMVQKVMIERDRLEPQVADEPTPVSDIVIEWGWPGGEDINVHDKEFVERLDAFIAESFPHYTRGVMEQVRDTEWFVNVFELSSPEKSKVWEWIESQGLTNQEA